ncbi:MAG: hypothetical protein NTX42_00105 [Methanothrix sp.]|nr:hypothetical protein [Methanothrix sp.]
MLPQSRPRKNAQCGVQRHLALRPDRPPDPERLPGNRARLADSGSGPGWPLPASGYTDEARGALGKNCPFLIGTWRLRAFA